MEISKFAKTTFVIAKVNDEPPILPLANITVLQYREVRKCVFKKFRQGICIQFVRFVILRRLRKLFSVDETKKHFNIRSLQLL